MNKTIKLISTVASILTMVCLGNTAFAAPVMIDLNDFFADPTVTVEADGSSALIAEDPSSPSVLLSNDPFWGDPNVIVPGMGTTFSFDYDFVQFDNFVGVDSENDEFIFFLFDSNTLEELDYFFTDTSTSGSYSLDISSYTGRTLGFQFQLDPVLFDQNDNPADSAYDSTVTVSNMQLNTVATPVPETSTTVSFLLGSLLLLLVKRWQK